MIKIEISNEWWKDHIDETKNRSCQEENIRKETKVISCPKTSYRRKIKGWEITIAIINQCTIISLTTITKSQSFDINNKRTYHLTTSLTFQSLKNANDVRILRLIWWWWLWRWGWCWQYDLWGVAWVRGKDWKGVERVGFQENAMFRSEKVSCWVERRCYWVRYLLILKVCNLPIRIIIRCIMYWVTMFTHIPLIMYKRMVECLKTLPQLQERDQFWQQQSIKETTITT